MVFEIQGKVALVTGGAGGIGFSCAKALLRNGLKGIAIVDISEELGHNAMKELRKEYGENRTIFIRADVSDNKLYEGALKETVETFKNLDIVINNAGCFNERAPEKVVAVNLNAVITGTYLAIEHFLQEFRSGSEGVVVNIASIAGLGAIPAAPVYTCTKFGVVGMSKAFGHELHYKRTNVRVLALCPGFTSTTLLTDVTGKTLGKPYEDLMEELLPHAPTQEADCVGSALVKIVQKAKSGSVWVAEERNDTYEFVQTTKDSCIGNTLE